MQESGNTAWVGLLIFVILFWAEMILLLFGDVVFLVFSVAQKYLSALGGYF